MKHYYTYRITNKLIGMHYYGYRSTNKDPFNDLGVKYFSSSKDKEFIKDQKENPQNFRYKIIKIFNNKLDAINLEIKLHNKFNVGVNPLFYNKSKQTSNKFDTTGNKEISTKVNITLSKVGDDGLTVYQRNQKRRLESVKEKYITFTKYVPWSTKQYYFEPHIIDDKDYKDSVKPSLSSLNRIFRNLDKKITIEAYRQSEFLKSFSGNVIGLTYRQLGFNKVKRVNYG